MPNLAETVVAMLAATSIGATWASCGAELGPTAVLDRFGQIKPKVLFAADGYVYGNRVFNILPNVKQVVNGIGSIERVILISNLVERPLINEVQKAERYDEIVTSETAGEIRFEQLPFDHPVYIMFSSGTTGKPKCMVQGFGVLLNELKDTALHADVKSEDRVTYITSASWMMWNWLVSTLGSGATAIFYDGNPNYPDWRTMWKLINDEGITIFGCSATYINYLRSIDARPKEVSDFLPLKEISQTGSPLSAEGFEWVYERVKRDMFFNSISGGTDINGVFAGGNPILPVYAGELASPCLGMKVTAYDEEGNSVVDKEGELVCEAPSPSMPIYFWNDPGDEKYKDAYFNFYRGAGKNVWRHGDYIIVHGDTRGMTFLGRSDSVLKPSGVRIGTAEIYAVVERMPEIMDSVVVGQNWKGDQRIILFVKLAPGETLTEELKQKIKQGLREEASPRHVPAVIMETPSIPYTFNMKKVESAVRNIFEGKPVTNREALTNPESLDYYEKVLRQLQR
jgi:acetoacetyl-CoA synthetase